MEKDENTMPPKSNNFKPREYCFDCGLYLRKSYLMSVEHNLKTVALDKPRRWDNWLSVEA
jgi:hypothetical protein